MSNKNIKNDVKDKSNYDALVMTKMKKYYNCYYDTNPVYHFHHDNMMIMDENDDLAFNNDVQAVNYDAHNFHTDVSLGALISH